VAQKPDGGRQGKSRRGARQLTVIITAKAKSLLDWTPRAAEVSVLDCARSLIATGSA